MIGEKIKISGSSAAAGLKAVRFRSPNVEDGQPIHNLIGRCAPLDRNSLYCNLLQCSHFSDTCLVAERLASDNAALPIAFVSAYRKPQENDVLFVWQIAVDGSCRGEGLAGKLLDELLQRPAVLGVRFIETTVTPDNGASAALFRRFAEKLAAPLTTSTLFSSAQHFGGTHADEVLYRIGPLPRTH